MKRKLNIAGRIVEIEATNTTCDANQWGWTCSHLVRRGGHRYCKLFRTLVGQDTQGTAYRVPECLRCEVPPPEALHFQGGGMKRLF